MKKQKSIKTITKRFKATKKGKILKRKCGQNHLNAKESGKITRKKRQDVNLAKSDAKEILKLIK